MKVKNFSHRSLAVVWTTILLLVAIPVTAAFAATGGPNYPGTASTGGGQGDAWAASAGTIVAALGADGGTTVSADVGTEDLIMSNFGFSIPTNATITGISVEINRWANDSNVFDNQLQLRRTGNTGGIGDDKSSASQWSTSTSTIATYGGASDLWGTTWTPSQINSSDFGLILDATSSSNFRTATVDYVRITVTYTVPEPQNPTLTVTNSPVTYNGSPQAATVEGSVPGTVSDVKYDGSSTVPMNAGTYAITADFVPTDTTNYNSLNDASAGNFTINKATPTASITNSPVIYNGLVQTAEVACSGGGAATLASGGSGTDAGSYAATVDCAESANYNAATGLSAGNFVIQKAAPTASVTNSPVTYNGAVQTAEVACSGGGAATLANGGTGTNAGTYPAIVDCAASTNYNAASGLAAGNFVIQKATPTASVTNSPVAYNGAVQTAEVACSGGGAATLASGGSGTDAGSYPATVDCAESTNYNAATGLSAGNFVIDPANQTITFGALVYKFLGDPDFAVSATASSGLTVSFSSTTTDVCTVTADGTVVHLVTTGTCTIQASQAGNTNYNAAAPVDRSFVVYPTGGQPLTITGVTVDNKVYDGNTTATLNTGSAALVGVAGGDDVNLVSAGATAEFIDKNVGTGKTVIVSGFTLSGADAGKYFLAQPTPTADITALDLTVTATGVDKVYDGTTTATVTLSSDALVGDVVTFTYTAAFADANVGTDKAVNVSAISAGGADGGNYNLLNTTANTTANITQAPLTVTANNHSKTIGQPDPTFTFSYSGFVNGETSAVLNTLPTCGVTVPHTAAGTYPIVCSGGADDNYSFTYVNGTLTVNAVMSQTFDDVPTNYWAWEFVERLYAAGITSGCQVNPVLNYCPGSSVTRAEMAVFLLRGIHGSSYVPPAVGTTTGFGDVPTTHWAAAWIKQFAAEGITVGCGNGNYCPDNAVTRAEMAVFLLRSKHGTSFVPPAVGTTTGFGDVPTTHWAAVWIKQLVAESITAGCGSGNYCPDNAVTRAEMAVFLVRTFNLP